MSKDDLNIYRLSMLLDFYGQLLTENQYNCLDLHCNQDLSMAEIAEELNISRQGVYDFIKKGRERLLEYEDKLKLLERFTVNVNARIKNCFLNRVANEKSFFDVQFLWLVLLL